MYQVHINYDFLHLFDVPIQATFVFEIAGKCII